MFMGKLLNCVLDYTETHSRVHGLSEQVVTKQRFNLLRLGRVTGLCLLLLYQITTIVLNVVCRQKKDGNDDI